MDHAHSFRELATQLRDRCAGLKNEPLLPCIAELIPLCEGAMGTCPSQEATAKLEAQLASMLSHLAVLEHLGMPSASMTGQIAFWRAKVDALRSALHEAGGTSSAAPPPSADQDSPPSSEDLDLQEGKFKIILTDCEHGTFTRGFLTCHGWSKDDTREEAGEGEEGPASTFVHVHQEDQGIHWRFEQQSEGVYLIRLADCDPRYPAPENGYLSCHLYFPCVSPQLWSTHQPTTHSLFFLYCPPPLFFPPFRLTDRRGDDSDYVHVNKRSCGGDQWLLERCNGGFKIRLANPVPASDDYPAPGEAHPALGYLSCHGSLPEDHRDDDDISLYVHVNDDLYGGSTWELERA